MQVQITYKNQYDRVNGHIVATVVKRRRILGKPTVTEYETVKVTRKKHFATRKSTRLFGVFLCSVLRL
jgi:hypothetical protein